MVRAAQMSRDSRRCAHSMCAVRAPHTRAALSRATPAVAAHHDGVVAAAPSAAAHAPRRSVPSCAMRRRDSRRHRGAARRGAPPSIPGTPRLLERRRARPATLRRGLLRARGEGDAHTPCRSHTNGGAVPVAAAVVWRPGTQHDQRERAPTRCNATVHIMMTMTRRPARCGLAVRVAVLMSPVNLLMAPLRGHCVLLYDRVDAGGARTLR